MKKFFPYFAAMAVIALALTSCQTKGRLAEIAEEATKQCPISMGMTGNIVSIEFDGEDMVYNIDVDETFVNLDVLEANKEQSKTGALQVFVNPDESVREMVKELKSADAGLKMKFKGRTSGKTVECYLSIDDINAVLDNPQAAGNPDDLLMQSVNVTNAQCPMPLGNGLVMNRVEVEGDNVVYFYDTDEDIISLDQLEQNREQAMQSLRQELFTSSDPTVSQFLKLCKNARKNVVYRYCGSTSGNTVDFTISQTEF